MGDLAVAGAPVIGRYMGFRTGHALTGRLLRAVMADAGAYERILITPDQAHSLPGAGLRMQDLLAPAA
jgi:UDP-3-O-[3-hydroxymyristoyl] N-acetylglucosamine deacetylase